MLRIRRNIIASWCCLLSLSAELAATESVASKAYTLVTAPCPNNFTLVRMAGSPRNQTLSAGESAYVQARRTKVLPGAWKAYLANVEATGITLPGYVSTIPEGTSSRAPSVGIAFSGGGYRSAFFGAAMLNVLDGRNATLSHTGFGGLLQASTYTTATSTGWLTLSLVQADFPMIQELVFGYQNTTLADDPNSWGGWLPNYDIILPSSNLTADVEYLTDVLGELEGKEKAGFNVSLADLWGRLLARHFLNGTSPFNLFDESYAHGAGNLLSSIVDTYSFSSYSMPFPIVGADLSSSNQNTTNIVAGNVIPLSNPVIEFNPYETGSFDPMLSAFTPTKYLGTINNSDCVTGYDQMSFVQGAISDIFNELNTTDILESLLGPNIFVRNPILSDIKSDTPAASLPNTFHGVAPDTFIDSNESDLTMVGVENGENILLRPLLVKARNVDTIFAMDASADTAENFANGTSLIVTRDAAKMFAQVYSFPPVPTTADEFLAQDLTKYPVFFGCNVTRENASTPLLIYLANGGPPDGEVAVTNTSSFQTSYSTSEAQAILNQATIIATQGRPANAGETSDPEWPACLACEVVDRARERAGEMRGGVCKSCFARYCWPGSTVVGKD